MKLGNTAIFLAAFSLSIMQQGAFAQESDEKTPGRLIAQGEGLAKGGRWLKAQELFLKACSEDPSNVIALHDLAVSYAHTNQLAEAAECERKALAVDEKYVASHIELAWVLNKLDNKDSAREHLKRVLELEPENKAARKSLEAMSMPRLRRKNDSSPAPESASSRSSSLNQELLSTKETLAETAVSKALVARGTSMYRQGKNDLAKRFFQQALENCPDSVSAHAALGVVLGTGGDFEGQIKEERKALRLDPKNASLMCNLAWALAQKGDAREALLNYQKALELSPNLADAQAGQGVLLYRTGKPEAAVAVLKEAVRVNPDQALLRLSLGSVLQSLERHEEASNELLEAMKLAPNNNEVKGRLAATYLEIASYNKAADLYKQLVERSPGNVEFRIGLGLALTKNNDLNGAAQQFKRACELDKNSAAAHAGLSMLEELKGRIAQAEIEARLAQERDPNCQFFRESVDRLAKSRKDIEM